MKRLLNNKTILISVGLVLGLAAGWLLFHNDGKIVEHEQHDEHAEERVYTCAMHPQIRLNSPGSCPICGMELIPLGEFLARPNIVEMSSEAVKLSNIQTVAIRFMLPEKELFLQGKVQVDERSMSSLSAQIDGRIENLYVSFTGESVKAGQKLASLYSPELVTAQKELFEAIKTKESSPLLYKAARNKLKQWKLVDAQIKEIEKAGKVQELMDIRADISGVVLRRKVSVGDHVKEGTVLFAIADLSKLWVEFDAYEADLSWLKIGDEIAFTVSSLPGVEFKQKLTFIDPMIDPHTRTASVRLEVDNRDGKLKPEMFATGTVMAKQAIDEAHLAVPKSAVMWTGKRSVVYVAIPNLDQALFEFREITVGHDLGAFFLVEDGLEEGEMVVTNGTFKLDAAAQLAGKKSMMNKEGGIKIHGHQHGDVP